MWICIFASLAIMSVVKGQQKCYVCVPPKGSGGEVEQLFPNSKLSICGDALEAKICPEGYKGCLTQTRRNEVTRTCSSLDVETCQVLNDVQYCYCRGQLCNGATKSPYKPPPDDEDLGEGSGSDSSIPTQVLLPKPTTTTTPTKTGGVDIATSSSLLIVISIFSFYLLR